MGREALVERADGQYDRVSDYLIEASGRPQQDVFQLIEEIVERRKTTAGPLYQKSFEEAPLESSIINELLESPLMKKSITKASADLGPGEAPITIDSPISFQNLHSIKMSLDDDISESFRSGQKNRGSKLMDAKRTLLDEMDSQNEIYREARDIFAGDSALKDAIDAGRDFWKQDPRLTTKQINKLSDSERDMYLSGAMDSIRQLMDRAADSRDLVKVIFGNRQFRDKIRAVTKTDDAFERPSSLRWNERPMPKELPGRGSWRITNSKNSGRDDGPECCTSSSCRFIDASDNSPAINCQSSGSTCCQEGARKDSRAE